MEPQGKVVLSGEGLVRFIYLLLVTIAIIVGNILVIVAVGKFRKLRRSTNIMLASLALADLMVGILTVPLYIAWTMHPGIFDHSSFLCHTVLLSCLLVVAASQINLLFLSIERYLAVCEPFKHRNIMICCPWLHKAIVCLTWVVSLTTTGLASLAMRSDYDMCNYYKVFDKWFLFFAVIFGIFIPFIAIIFMNLRVFLIVRQHEIRRKFFGFENSDSNRPKSDSSEQEMCPSLHSQVDSRHSKQDKWTAVCLLLCRGQCYDKDSLDNDVFINEQENSDIKPDQRNVSPFLKQRRRVTDIDRLVIDTTCVDATSGSPPFQEIKNSIHQNHGHFNVSPYKRWSDNTRHEYDSILKLTQTSGRKHPLTISENVMTPDMEIFRFDKGTWKNFRPDPCIRTKKHPYKTLSNFPLDKDLSSSEQTLLINSRIDATDCKQRKSPSLSFGHNIFKVPEIKSTPTRIKKLLDGTTKDSPNKVLGLSLSKMTSSLPLVNIQSTYDNFLPESHISKIQAKDRKIKKKYRLTESNDMETGLLLKNSFTSSHMSPQRQNIQEALSLQNFDIMSLDSGIVSQLSNIQNNKNYTESCLLNNLRKYSVCMDNERHAEMGNSLNGIDQSTIKSLLHPQICLDEHPNPSTLSPKVLTRILSEAESLDKMCPCRTSVKVTHQHPPQFMSTQSIIDRSLDLVCHCHALKRRSSAPAFFQSVAEVKPDSIDVTQQWKLRRQSEPPQRSIKRRDTHLGNFRFGARSMRRTDTGLSSRKVSSCDRGSFGQRAYISKKVARTVALVCASFILAWLPFFTVIIVNTFCAECNLAYFLNAVLMVAFAQSALNPIIYALCHASFRNAYKSLFSQICTKSDLT